MASLILFGNYCLSVKRLRYLVSMTSPHGEKAHRQCHRTEQKKRSVLTKAGMVPGQPLAVFYVVAFPGLSTGLPGWEERPCEEQQRQSFIPIITGLSGPLAWYPSKTEPYPKPNSQIKWHWIIPYKFIKCCSWKLRQWWKASVWDFNSILLACLLTSKIMSSFAM